MAIRAGAVFRYTAYLVLAAAIAAAFLVWKDNGSIQWPDPDTVRDLITKGGSAGATTAQVVAALGIVACVLCAALAPLLFAIRAEDGLTIVISIVLMIATWWLMFASRTMLDMTLAAVIYLANICLSGAVYVAHTVRRGLREQMVTSAQELRF